MIKVYVDDERHCPEGWHLCKNIKDARDFIEENYENISHISFDGYLSKDMPMRTGALLIRDLSSLKKYEDINVFHQPRENYTCHSADSYLNLQMNGLLDDHFGIVSEDIRVLDEKWKKPTLTQLQRLRKSKGRR